MSTEPLTPFEVDLLATLSRTALDKGQLNERERHDVGVLLRLVATVQAAWRQSAVLAEEVNGAYPEGVDPQTVAHIMAGGEGPVNYGRCVP